MARGGAGKSGTEFTAKLYLAAGVERAGVLESLHDADEYVLAVYAAGLAVECVLRAYRVRVDPEFSSRHDLWELAAEARFADLVPGLAEKYAADLGAVAVRWSNNHRFRTAAALLKYLKRAGLDRRVKGDVLKENSRRIVNAALDLVTLGARLWKS